MVNVAGQVAAGHSKAQQVPKVPGSRGEVDGWRCLKNVNSYMGSSSLALFLATMAAHLGTATARWVE